MLNLKTLNEQINIMVQHLNKMKQMGIELALVLYLLTRNTKIRQAGTIPKDLIRG
jgi:hypothetical protein